MRVDLVCGVAVVGVLGKWEWEYVRGLVCLCGDWGGWGGGGWLSLSRRAVPFLGLEHECEGEGGGLAGKEVILMPIKRTGIEKGWGAGGPLQKGADSNDTVWPSCCLSTLIPSLATPST